MRDDYKWFKEPYTLSELLEGSDLFKYYYNFFYEIHYWRICTGVITSKEPTVDELEILFNEYLDIISLFLYDKNEHFETIKKLQKKLETSEKFVFLASDLPYMLEKLLVDDYSKTPKLIQTILDQFTKKTKTLDKDINGIKVLEAKEISEELCENLREWRTKENLRNLTYFFDIAIDDQSEYLRSSFPSKKKKVDILKENPVVYETVKQVILIDKLTTTNNWKNLSARSKAKIIYKIIGKSDRKIRDVISEIDKKPSQQSDKFGKNYQIVETFLKELGC